MSAETGRSTNFRCVLEESYEFSMGSGRCTNSRWVLTSLESNEVCSVRFVLSDVLGVQRSVFCTFCIMARVRRGPLWPSTHQFSRWWMVDESVQTVLRWFVCKFLFPYPDLPPILKNLVLLSLRVGNLWLCHSSHPERHKRPWHLARPPAATALAAIRECLWSHGEVWFWNPFFQVLRTWVTTVT